MAKGVSSSLRSVPNSNFIHLGSYLKDDRRKREENFGRFKNSVYKLGKITPSKLPQLTRLVKESGIEEFGVYVRSRPTGNGHVPLIKIVGDGKEALVVKRNADKIGFSGSELIPLFTHNRERWEGAMLIDERVDEYLKLLLGTILNQVDLVDRLTGLPNGEVATLVGAKALSESKHWLLVLYFDLLRFKLVNDLFNHKTGDLAIKWFGELLANNVRTYFNPHKDERRAHHSSLDIVGGSVLPLKKGLTSRLFGTGDEFAAMLPIIPYMGNGEKEEAIWRAISAMKKLIELKVIFHIIKDEEVSVKRITKERGKYVVKATTPNQGIDGFTVSTRVGGVLIPPTPELTHEEALEAIKRAVVVADSLVSQLKQEEKEGKGIPRMKLLLAEKPLGEDLKEIPLER